MSPALRTDSPASRPSSSPARGSTPEPIVRASSGDVRRLLDSALKIAEALAADDSVALRTSASAWVEQGLLPSADLDLQSGRAYLPKLAAAVGALLRQHGNLSEGPMYSAYCPMAGEGQGGRWWQKTDEVRNPYFGAEMLGCGEIKASVAPGAMPEGRER